MLQIGNGGTSGSLVGDIELASAGMLAFNRSDSLNYAGILSGAGGFTKDGSGDLTLSGDSSGFAGHTDVAGGTLIVGLDGDGSLGGTLDVLDGGRLEGTGTVRTTTIANGGTVAPGNSIGTLAIAGDYTQAAGSTYEAEIDPTGNSDLIDVKKATSTAASPSPSLRRAATAQGPATFWASGGHPCRRSGTYRRLCSSRVSIFHGLQLRYSKSGLNAPACHCQLKQQNSIGVRCCLSKEGDQVSERQFELIVAENLLLAHIAADEPLPATLDLLTKSVEQYTDGTVLASVLLMDSDGVHLRHGAAPSLPPTYTQAIDGSEIGPANGSCGTAAYLKKPVYVADIERDPLWENYRQLALPHGLKACWSTPILSKADAVLGTFALYHRESRLPDQREKELVELLVKTATLAIERQHAREQQKLLLEEMAHRVKNTLAVVLSIAGGTLRGKTEPASYEAFESRLIALSQTQNLLVRTNWLSADVRDLVTTLAVTPFAGNQMRFLLEGPRALLAAQLTLPFALAIHELCTNAAKYGALTADAGRVLINWGYKGQGDEPDIFHFIWRETNGPTVHAPARQGFGSRVLNHAFATVTGSNVKVEFRPEGLHCEIILPADQVSRARKFPAQPHPPA